jgi:8-hydroxy-5-deazaflavin:NADPH oxidoreductase
VAYRIALIGGTGPEGRGLATRFALAGHTVVIGSRDAARATHAAVEVTARLQAAGHANLAVAGAANADAAAGAELVVLAVPYEAQRTTLEALEPALAAKIVIDAVVPVRFERGPRPIEVPEGSAAEQAAALLPRSRVIGAFHTIAAETLLDPTAALHEDVLVTGDDAEAKALVRALAEEIAGVRTVDAGPLRYSRFVEGITVLLIGINGRYHAHAGVRIEGLPA